MQYTNFDAIVKNARFFKTILGKSKLCAVLKNNAYGHGIVRTASALQDIADFFAVGNVQEALQVKDFCPNVLILLPVHSQEEIALALQHGFILTVDSFFTFFALQNAVQNQKARVHVKVETGMNRLGFGVEQLPALLQQLNCQKVAVEGVFSHFWGETATQCDGQLEKFQQACSLLSARFPSPICHVANTSATLLNEKYRMDMCRVGLGLYGYGAPNLSVAKTVAAKVIAIRSVRAGESVGYGAEYVFPSDTTVAIVRCGYANGFPRALKNAKVKIGEQLFPVVGNVCMAMLAVDVKNSRVQVGDDVVLLGKGVNNANCDVIVYELLCNLR
ncbi:MAG: alanine racemase [Candidatus Fimimonas sp.]